MRIAIPLASGRICMHFGHCEEFALIDVDADSRAIVASERAVPPPHAPGVIPDWLASRKADLVLAGGMGSRAQQMFAQKGIEVAVGAPDGEPEELVAAYLDGTLQPGENICDH